MRVEMQRQGSIVDTRRRASAIVKSDISNEAQNGTQDKGKGKEKIFKPTHSAELNRQCDLTSRRKDQKTCAHHSPCQPAWFHCV